MGSTVGTIVMELAIATLKKCSVSAALMSITRQYGSPLELAISPRSFAGSWRVDETYIQVRHSGNTCTVP